ncbi:eukaryotic cytochrome b561-domain-containing protein [Choanephora cucurbitarum]|nr:eukaryotic cytochrome b561-domain-containing protein [Choanephora cucurbitarum]
MQNSELENQPLLNNPPVVKKQDTYGKWSIMAGVGLFVALVLSVLVRLPVNIFTGHPIFMVLLIIFVTEGIALLQPTSTPLEKKEGLRKHAIVQSATYLSAIGGFSFIFYNKVVAGKYHFESFHGKLGLFVFIFLAVQLVFGITMAYFPEQVFGSVSNGKNLWKYHRISGYILLSLVWLTAQLGVRADYMYNNLYSVQLIWLHWVAVALVAFGVISRIRFTKWGLQP